MGNPLVPWRAVVGGLLGAVAGGLLLLLAWTAYTDHQMLWTVVQVLQQPRPVPSPAHTEAH